MDVLRTQSTIAHYITSPVTGKPVVLSGLSAYLTGSEKKLNYTTGSNFALWLSSTLDDNIVTYRFAIYQSEDGKSSPRKIGYEIIASYDNVLQTVKINRYGGNNNQWIIYVEQYQWMVIDADTVTLASEYGDSRLKRIIVDDQQLVLMIEDRIIPLYFNRPKLVADWSCNPPLINSCVIEVTARSDTLTYTFDHYFESGKERLTSQIQYYTNDSRTRHYVRIIFHHLGLVATFYETDNFELVISRVSDGSVLNKLDSPRQHKKCVQLFQCMDDLYHYLTRYQ